MEESVFSPKGRIRRSTYFLRCILFGFTSGIIQTFALLSSNINFLIFSYILMVTFCILIIIQAVKRLHDIERSGWYWLIFLIPIVNIIFGFYLLLTDGTIGKNQYGSDPKNRSREKYQWKEQKVNTPKDREQDIDFESESSYNPEKESESQYDPVYEPEQEIKSKIEPQFEPESKFEHINESKQEPELKISEPDLDDPTNLKFNLGTLTFLTGPDKGRIETINGFLTHEGYVATLGRTNIRNERAEAHIYIDNTYITVSRQQLELVYKHKQMFIRNKSQSNITLLNGKPLNNEILHDIKTGDRIQAGELELIYEI